MTGNIGSYFEISTRSSGVPSTNQKSSTGINEIVGGILIGGKRVGIITIQAACGIDIVIQSLSSNSIIIPSVVS